MAKTYRVGSASLVHDHIWSELKHWQEQPNVEVVATGDVNNALRERASTDYGIPNVYNSWQEMLEREELDIVQAASENSICADIVEACAGKGIHVVSEKPMAATLAQADRMLSAAAAAGTLLMINNLLDDQEANGLVGSGTGVGTAAAGGRHWHDHKPEIPLCAQWSEGNWL